MSEGDRTAENRACGDDVAAYALGALDAAEVEAFRRHLSSCSVCRDELAAFEQVARVLPDGAPMMKAPPELRRRVMRAVESEPKQAAPARAARTPRGAARGARRWALPRPALAFGAALAVAVAAFVGIEVNSSQTTSARTISAQVTGQGTAQLKLAGGHAQLVVHHFQPPPAGQIYEVWLQHGTAPPSPTTALFSVNAAGEGDVDVPGSLHGVSMVLVTPEPAGGTTVPTHPAVISASLT
jgi:anti-sigma-K factor RskA